MCIHHFILNPLFNKEKNKIRMKNNVIKTLKKFIKLELIEIKLTKMKYKELTT